MFNSDRDLFGYVIASFPDVTDARLDDNHWDLQCTKCKITRGFQVFKRVQGEVHTAYGRSTTKDLTAPITVLFRCPVCKAFKQWIVYEANMKDGETVRKHYFRVASVPSEGMEEVDELPSDPPELRAAYREAVRAMDANAPMAAAAMFRRALQIITRKLLQIKPDSLANELNKAVGMQLNGATIKQNFAAVGYILKETGNQAAHPDKDPDLLSFTAKDASDLQQVFMEIITELFVIPAAAAKAREDFLQRRKIKPAVQAQEGTPQAVPLDHQPK